MSASTVSVVLTVLPLYGIFLSVVVFGIWWLARRNALRGLELRIARLEAAVAQLRASLAAQPSSHEGSQAAVPVASAQAVHAEAAAAPTPAPPPVAQSAPARSRPGPQGREWEAIIGGSWLNKLGVLVFVIGLSLFVGYSLTLHIFGPLARITAGTIVSLAMLIGGVALERRQVYKMYARGLIGGGWSGLYFTAYAAHGIAAARVVASPVLATGLLITVAAGMILHSLRYRSEVVTGLAYFGAFAALAISALSNFALFASIPLAASLLFITQRFRWRRVMIAGLVVTYLTYLMITTGGPVSNEIADRDLSVLVLYWLLFEVSDLLDAAGVRSGGADAGDFPRAALFPLNTCAFIGVSLLEWLRFRPFRLDTLLACITGAFLLDALVRAVIRPPKSFTPEQDAVRRAAAGGYEGAITVAALLAAATTFQHFSGLEIEIALLLEAEMLIFAGLGLREQYLQRLGGFVFVMPVAKLIFLDIFNLPEVSRASILGLEFSRWSLTAGVACASAYLNRASIRERYAEAYAYLALLVAALVILVEVPVDYRGVSWLIIGGLSFEAGLWFAAADLRMQGYLAMALGALALVVASTFGWEGASARGQEIALVLAAAAAYGLALQTNLGRQNLPADARRVVISDSSLYAANAFVALLLYNEVSGQMLTEAWALEGALLLIVGFAERQRVLRYSGLLLLGVCVLKVFFYDLRNLETLPRIFSFIVLGVLMLAVSFVYTRYYERLRRYL
jgi:uncharacterized membrane protein